MNLYTEKNTNYFTNIRHDLIKLLPKNPENKVLELGSGGGDTLVEIKKRNLAKEVTGVELMQVPGSNQSHQLIDRLIFADVQKQDLQLPESYFDAILIGDVLEHLEDPWNAIAYLSRFLKKGGVFITSVPNIRYFIALYKIYIKGDFGYQKQGLFDKTHLRFFCKKNIQELFTTPFLEVESITPIGKLQGDKSFISIFNVLTLRIFEQFLTLQYIVVAKKI